MPTEIYNAAWLVPMDGDPFDDAEIVVEDGILVEVRKAKPSKDSRRSFPNAVLLPGLINAHTHIEYTALRGFLEDVPFFPWIRALTAMKPKLDREDWLRSGRLGLLEMIAGGITTIGDNTDASITAQAAQEAGLRGVVFQEVFGIDESAPVEAIIAGLDAKLNENAEYAGERIELGVSPHAPYTVRPALFAALADYVEERGLRTSIHVGETLAEVELIERGTGPFAEMFARRGINWRVPGVSPTRYAYDMRALNERTLAVHCVHQNVEEITLLAKSAIAVVHCPKSNAKLGAGIAPLADWMAAGLKVAIGTDSAVSNNSLDLFEEMRYAVLTQRAARSDVSAATACQVLRMATVGGADALGLAGRVGTLTPGKRADFIAVDLDRPHIAPASDPVAALVYSARASDVLLTVCDGRILYDRGTWFTLEPRQILKEARQVRDKAKRETPGPAYGKETAGQS